MGQIFEIEQALIDRLVAEIDGVDAITRPRAMPDGGTVLVPVQIKPYPSSPTDAALKTLSATGTVLVRYTGSKYGTARRGTRPDGSPWMAQDRVMLYEVMCLADTLLPSSAASGIYAMLDLCGTRLMGFRPESAVADIELVQDDYVAETRGSWEYGIIVAVRTQKKVGPV